MNDARRFFRYIIPGITFFIQISMYFAISDTDGFMSLIGKLKGNYDGLGIAVTLLFTLGGIGFLLGILYHFLYWRKYLKIPTVNHCNMIKDMIGSQWLEVKPSSGNKVVKFRDNNKGDQKRAWQVVTAYWHSRRNAPKIGGANERIDSLGNTMHGLGTAYVGSVLAFFIWFGMEFLPFFAFYWGTSIIKFESACSLILYSLSHGLVLALAFIISFVQQKNYEEATRDFNNVIDIICADQIKNEYSKSRKPVVIIISLNEQEKQSGCRCFVCSTLACIL